MKTMIKRFTFAALLTVAATDIRAQLLATDNFESYAGSPIGQSGGSGIWSGNWAFNTQLSGGAFLSADSKVSGTKSLGLYGSSGATGTSVSRPFPACTNETAVRASLRADYDVSNNALAPAGQCRMAFTVRTGNGASHFDNQVVSFYFAAGNANLQWYDGTDRSTTSITFTANHVYDLAVSMTPADRTYAFTASNRNTSAVFSYAGAWTTGANGQPLGSVAFLMRGPSGAGNDAFLDEVSVSAPAYIAPPPAGPHTVEGALWRYAKGTATPVNQGTNNWTSIAFDDSGWLGPASTGFGYGDCDDATELSDMRSNYPSIFIRRSFVVTNTAAITHLTLAADYDDGFIAYLNGTEIARTNLPAGAIIHTNLALTNHDPSRGEGQTTPPLREKEYFVVNPSVLVSGTNVLAVSGHNSSLTSSDFSLIVELYTNASLVRGPFIQMPNPGNRATVVWKTAAIMDGVVDYGLDLSYASGSVTNPALSREHAVELANLQPGTSYYYRVRSNGETLAEGLVLRTRPTPTQAFRFAVIGDHGQGTSAMYDIADRVNARTDFEAILTVGDNVYGISPCEMDGAPGWYDPYWFKLYEPTMRRVATFPALGNHDWDTASGQWMVDFFRLPTNGPVNHIGKNFSFDFGNMHVVSVDTEPYEDNTTATINEINAWFSADLAATTQKWKVVLLHRPPYTSTGGHGENANVKLHLVPRMEAAGVQVVFQGHNHWYERINPVNGIHYITTGSAGAGLYVPSLRRDYSAVLYNALHSYTVVDVQDGRMTIEQVNLNGETIDEHIIDLDHPFLIDGRLDNPSWQRASNNLNLYAAIRGNHLYAATQDAGEGNDHFLYLASAAGGATAVNWAKAGTVMTWSAFLADENSGAFQGWFDAAQAQATDPATYRSMTPGLNNNGTNGNGVLEGTLHVPNHFGGWPTQLLFAAAPFGDADGGALVSSAQVPAGNGNGNIEAAEFLALNTRDLALDLPSATAGGDQTVEAGMWAILDGTSSSSPISFPLTFAWSQVSGPAVLAANTNLGVAAITPSSNVASNTPVIFRLVVNDGRFDSDEDQVTVTFSPMVDSDGDGLSDNEETTGWDNILTAANPGGQITLPNDADSDDDLVSDGEEALAGTDPNNTGSSFRLLSGRPSVISGVEIDWSTISGRQYEVYFASETVTSPWQSMATFTATTDVTRTTDTNASDASLRIYRIGAKH